MCWFGQLVWTSVWGSRVLHCRNVTHCAHAQDCCYRLPTVTQSSRQLQQHQQHRSNRRVNTPVHSNERSFVTACLASECQLLACALQLS